MTEPAITGFLRPDGRVGLRNHLLVLAVNGLSVPTGRRIAAMVHPSIAIGMPYGSGLLGHDRAVHQAALEAMAGHPNVGAVLVVGADPPKVAAVGEAAAFAGKRVEAIALDDCDHDALVMTDRGVRAAAAMLKAISDDRRVPVPLSSLSLGLECGRSDPSSGLVANPLVGRIADLVVGAGGTAMIGETTEWLGAEHLLARRAATPEVARAILDAARARETLAVGNGLDLTGNNPSRTNIDAGLSSIEEKSLGAVAKSGSGPIAGLIGYGARPPGAGLWVMDAPAYAPESITGFALAQANLCLFTTGVGNSYTSALMPTIKLTGNSRTADRLHEQLDFEAGDVFRGRERIEHAADRLMATIARIASGSLTWGEILGDHDEVVSRFGPAL
ncbi:MAG: UxaA family hydrolase [Geminicoccaceae bacterium]|nr:UxaA family hydrolase [Geminicoccaceae bacterium]